MDRFYEEQRTTLPSRDLQLTAVTSLFVASKNLEVDPLDLKTCVSTLCFNKYSRNHFLAKETAIRRACNYENEAPCTLDFILLYARLIKLQMTEQMQYSDHTVEFLLDVQTIAYDLCKSVTLDATMLKYKASVLAACMLFLGFQLQFELNMKESERGQGYELSTAAGKRKVSEICDVYRLYVRILEVALDVPEVPKIVDFCDTLFER